MDFRWNDWNLHHATIHGVTPEEAEEVAATAKPPFPERIDNDKWLVWGPTSSGRLVQVIYVEDDDEPDCVYVLHARPLTPREKARRKRRQR